MCDTNKGRGRGWIGWSALPDNRPLEATGPWLDLSHPVGPRMPCVPVFGPATVERFLSMPAHPYNATRLSMIVHTGTHLDAPFHFLADGPRFDEIPLARLTGAGVVWRIEKGEDETIDVADLEKARPKLKPGDILALDTGFAARVGTESYDRHPSLSEAAAHWLVESRIKLLACDFGTPDLPHHRRPKGFDWPVHHALLARGILICEHLTGHAALAGERVELAFAALNVEGADGAPARVMGRTVRA